MKVARAVPNRAPTETCSRGGSSEPDDALTRNRPGELTANFASFEGVIDAGAGLAAKSRLNEPVSEAAAPALR